VNVYVWLGIPNSCCVIVQLFLAERWIIVLTGLRSNFWVKEEGFLWKITPVKQGLITWIFRMKSLANNRILSLTNRSSLSNAPPWWFHVVHMWPNYLILLCILWHAMEPRTVFDSTFYYSCRLTWYWLFFRLILDW